MPASRGRARIDTVALVELLAESCRGSFLLDVHAQSGDPAVVVVVVARL